MVSAPCPVRRQALRNPGALALVAGADRWSWEQLDREVALGCGRLREGGIGPG